MEQVPVAGGDGLTVQESPSVKEGARAADGLSAGAAPWPLSERPGFLARRMHQIHVSLFAERCADFRVTPLQYSLLSLLRQLGQADQTTIAEAVALDRTTTTGALKRLAARGLVDRATSPTDRRAQICRLTAAGEALHGAMEAAAREAHARTVEALSDADQAHLIRLLRQVVAAHDDRMGEADLG